MTEDVQKHIDDVDIIWGVNSEGTDLECNQWSPHPKQLKGFKIFGSSHLGALTYTAARFILGSLSMIPVVLLFERQKLSAEEKRATLKLRQK